MQHSAKFRCHWFTHNSTCSHSLYCHVFSKKICLIYRNNPTDNVSRETAGAHIGESVMFFQRRSALNADLSSQVPVLSVQFSTPGSQISGSSSQTLTLIFHLSNPSSQVSTLGSQLLNLRSVFIVSRETHPNISSISGTALENRLKLDKFAGNRYNISIIIKEIHFQ